MIQMNNVQETCLSLLQDSFSAAAASKLCFRTLPNSTQLFSQNEVIQGPKYAGWSLCPDSL